MENDKKHWCCLARFRANIVRETTMIRCGIERPSIYLKLLASFSRSDLSFRSTSVVSVFIRFLDFQVCILIDLDGRASGELRQSHYGSSIVQDHTWTGKETVWESVTGRWSTVSVFIALGFWWTKNTCFTHKSWSSKKSER